LVTFLGNFLLLRAEVAAAEWLAEQQGMAGMAHGHLAVAVAVVAVGLLGAQAELAELEVLVLFISVGGKIVLWL
jgi:hypothetical protein